MKKATYLTLLLCLFSLFTVCAQRKKATDMKIGGGNMEDSVRLQFDYTLNGKPYDYTLIEFGSHYCVPCRLMESVVDSVRATCLKVNIRFVDAAKEANACWLDYFRIDIIPQQVVMDRRGKTIFRHRGYISYKELVEHFK